MKLNNYFNYQNINTTKNNAKAKFFLLCNKYKKWKI